VKRIDVLMMGYEVITQPSDKDLLKQLGDATRIDFETDAVFNTNEIPIREISHIIPVDYRKFKKFVSFNGGDVTPIPAQKEIELTEEAMGPLAQAGAKANLLAKTTRVKLGSGDYEQMLADEFHAQVNVGLHERWKFGYRIAAELPTLGTRIIIDGHHSSPLRSSQSDTEIHFKVPDDNEIPHFPNSNPHVLEQPPTI
jgi:hypothetical protein